MFLLMLDGVKYITAIPNDTGVDFNSNDNSFSYI